MLDATVQTATARFRQPGCVASITVPLGTPKCPRQTLQRRGIGLRTATILYRTAASPGQRCNPEHPSAASSSGNGETVWTKLSPLRRQRPGPTVFALPAEATFRASSDSGRLSG